jgi:hypothetical protein
MRRELYRQIDWFPCERLPPDAVSLNRRIRLNGKVRFL